MCGQINFFCGEEKLIDVSVVPKNKNEVVVVNSAKFEVIENSSGRIFQEGNFEIEGAKLTALLKIEKSGLFILKTIVKIGRETFIEKINIKVEE